MKFAIFASLIASALAVPAELAPRTGSSNACPAFHYSSPQCCATDVLGILCVNGIPPQDTPRDARHFREICAKEGQQARCCVLPVAGQALLCQPPV